MERRTVIWTRTKRYARLWLWDAMAETLAPLTNRNARLNYLAVLVVLLLVSPEWGPDKRLSWFASKVNAVEAIALSVPLFFFLNLALGIFRIRKQERELGRWFGPRFVYHEPQLLLTVLVDETDNGRVIPFEIKDAENGALVSYVIETDRTDKRAKVELAWPNGHRIMGFGMPMNLPKGSFRLPKCRKMSLLTHVEPESTVTTVRVFMTGWEVGKGDGRG